ncbi:DUF2063 domain-containing protein [Dechloromonas sp. TW-R-39-2]|uniref:HvfC family RiPP maturation protein n=1 Tax=Dechloromonas sp. TW-R-39-2 TaxID=2654218 RepID=UPI00193E1BAD|nr:putative DNA-binding domain-containing protein [Dechloromonas sp. TW-R-39-2]QRM19066.1 DUF2063 domain-containing protein [Dechloromonas sp. TW-R-39-2]
MSTPDFQTFQRALGRHLRDPRRSPRPAGIPARRMAIYNELLFTNICGFLDQCFPVCRATLGEQRWRRLNRNFFRDWPSHTPWFREIPQEFVRYLQAAEIRQPLPAWFTELAHYEWVELAVDIMDRPIPPHDPAGNLLIGQPLLNPTLMNLDYQWPVHLIGPNYRPRKIQPSQLLVFRDREDKVRFVASTPVTSRLLKLVGERGLNGRAACLHIASELHHPAPEALVSHGHAMLSQLREQGIILGTKS